jgi:transposase InsO family protein
MSHSGNVWDNAAMESFFSSLKTGTDRQKGLQDVGRRQSGPRSEARFPRSHASIPEQVFADTSCPCGRWTHSSETNPLGGRRHHYDLI